MAQTLKFGNKTWATKVGSTLAYNDLSGNYKPLPFAFTRSTSATRVNKEGLIEVVTNDRPRIDYTDTSDGVLLLEKAATNSLLQSNQFDTTWSATNATLTSGQIGVGGSTDAWKLESNSNTSESYLRQTTSLSGTSSLTIYAKKGNSNFLGVYIGSSGADIAAYFDLNNGIVGTNSNATETKIESVGNGWYRCTIVGSNINQNVNFYVTDANGNFLSNDGSYIYIQYSQLETGVASSYIPTQGSATTRVAETASGAGNSEVFSDSEGVLFADIKKHENGGSIQTISLSDGSTNNNIYLSLSSTPNQINVEVLASGGQANLSSTSTNQSNQNKFAVKYKQNDFALWINGFEIDTDNSGNTPVGLNKINFDFGQGSFDFYGKTKEIGYYDTILTDLELETLTSYKSWTSMVNELNLNIIYNG